jgi:hypothetical protein
MTIATNRMHQLETELTTRTQGLKDKRRQLASAESLFKRTRSDVEGAHVSRLLGEVHLAEIAIDGVKEEIERTKKPRPVQITSSRWQLARDREQIVQQRDYRHAQHQKQVDEAVQESGYRDPKHVANHVRNIFGSTERMRLQADQQDARRLADIDAQLAEIDRRTGSQPLDAA